MARAFEGVRVIDFTQVLAGPFCAEQLALLGADVIKVEQPAKDGQRGGDQGRSIMADNDIGEAGFSAIFVSVNAGKRSIALDLKAPETRPILEKLVASADVVVQNFKAGAIDRLGYGYEWARQQRADIVYCSISGYGQTGPYAGAPAYDGAIQAVSGMLALTGHPESGPTRSGFNVVDMSTGITAAFAISSALFRRAQTGEGQHVDVAMLDTALTMTAQALVRYTALGMEQPLIGNSSPAFLPTSGLFKTGGGDMMVSALTDGHWRGIAKAIGRPDIVDDPRFKDTDARKANGAAVREVMEQGFASADAFAWEKRLADCGVPAAPQLPTSEVLNHPALEHRDVVLEFENLPGVDRPLKGIGAAFTANVDGPKADRPPPALDQHRDEILREAGLL
jgi:crotonobetainyl-CoA:carnitine CoA-transferase CaiB-like acyl-CoA transferase